MAHHELKILREPFEDLLSGNKTGEIRVNDRNFQVEDWVHLKEMGSHEEWKPTGRTATRLITHIQSGFGLPEGLVVLSYRPVVTAVTGIEVFRVPPVKLGYSKGIVSGEMVFADEHYAAFDEVETKLKALEHQFDRLAKAVGFSEERLAQTGESPLECAEGLCEDRDEALALAKERGETIDRMEEEIGNLRHIKSLLDIPETKDWFKGVEQEAAHQVSRWGTDHDEGKSPADWFWLIGYLAQKAMGSHYSGDEEKARHHTITTAAVLLNWFRAITGEDNRMRPGTGRKE